ncbi:MAG: hypothetical protein AB1646_21685 [Thermodesulfobacteriota bacterium]
MLVRLAFLSLVAVGPLSFSGVSMAADSCAPPQWDYLSQKSQLLRHGDSVQGGPPFINTCDNNIRMDAMDVTIRRKYTTYVIDAEYRFFNTGATRREEVFFAKCGGPNSSDFIRFELWVNGRAIDFREEKDLPTRPCEPRQSPKFRIYFCPLGRLIVGDVTFAGDAPTTVRARYEAYYTITDYALEGCDGVYASSDQAAWKGPIGKASYIIDGNAVATDGKPPIKYRTLDWLVDRGALLQVTRFWEIGLIKCPIRVSFPPARSFGWSSSRRKANRGDLR